MRAINLLPAEQAKRAKTRQRAALLMLLLLAYLALLAAGWWLYRGLAAGTEEDVAAQQVVIENLRRQIGELEGAQQLRDEYEAAAAQITGALAVDAEWGRFLNDVGRVIPDRLWLVSFNASSEAPTEDAPLSYGSVSMGGIAFDYPDAATWLRTLNSVEWPAVDGAWVQSATATQIASFEAVNFSSTATLTAGILSNRAVERIPEVPQ